MNEFYAGIIACATMIGGICALIYWFFNVFEKRIEQKFDIVVSDVNRIANELREERQARDTMYKVVIGLLEK